MVDLDTHLGSVGVGVVELGIGVVDPDIEGHFVGLSRVGGCHIEEGVGG